LAHFVADGTAVGFINRLSRAIKDDFDDSHRRGEPLSVRIVEAASVRAAHKPFELFLIDVWWELTPINWCVGWLGRHESERNCNVVPLLM